MKNDINKIDNNVLRGAETAAQDPFNFPVPGHSLTDSPDKWSWDKPPRMTDPSNVVDFVIDKVESQGEVKEHFLRLMGSGITVEEIVNTIGLGGFTAGEFTPDVAEIIKPPLAVYFIGLAIENKVPVVAFSKKELEEDGKMISRRQTLDIMEERNPQEYYRLMSALDNKKEDLNMQKPEDEQPAGFINMESK